MIMFMDKKGKLFGKISIVDILIVVAVIVCAIGVYARFVDQPDKVVAKTQKFTYKILVSDVREMSVKALEQSIDTKFVLNEKGRSDIVGTLIDVKSEHSIDPIIKDDGTVVMAQVPTKYNVELTMELDGIVGDSGYFTTEYKSINVGADLLLMNKYISTSGKITEIIEK